jgi:hypothetical protein
MGAILGKQSRSVIPSIKTRDLKKKLFFILSTNQYDTVKSRKYVLLDKIRNIPEVAMVSLCT